MTYLTVKLVPVSIDKYQSSYCTYSAIAWAIRGFMNTYGWLCATSSTSSSVRLPILFSMSHVFLSVIDTAGGMREV